MLSGNTDAPPATPRGQAGSDLASSCEMSASSRPRKASAALAASGRMGDGGVGGQPVGWGGVKETRAWGAQRWVMSLGPKTRSLGLGSKTMFWVSLGLGVF